MKNFVLTLVLFVVAIDAVPQGKPWGPTPTDMQPVVEEAARIAIDTMSLRQLFDQGVIFSRIVSSSYLPAVGVKEPFELQR
jgi:hypothetical protein